MERYKRSFASDNNAIVHPKIMEALQRANMGHCLSYGEDAYTESARLLPLPTEDGKLRPEQVEPLLHALGVEHHSQPGVISVTQSTEVGTVYTVEELKSLTDFAHNKNIYVHMDGARIANAAASLNVSMKELTVNAGIDVLSFVQFEALLTDDLWLENAKHANEMAALLARQVKKIQGITITRPVEANAVFVTMPKEAAQRLMEKYYFYSLDEGSGEYRWMTSFDTQERDVMDFVAAVKEVMYE
jgi:threonine aldolase